MPEEETTLASDLLTTAPRMELEALYRTHFRQLTGYLRRCGLHDSAAVDVAQDTFVQALRNIDQFKGQSKLSTWVWAIARNQMLTYLRQAHTLPTHEESLIDPDSLTVELSAHLSDMKDCIRRGFAEFTRSHPERAQVIYLSAVEGWSIAEVAEFLGRTTHATTEYLSQCRAKLKPFIAQCNDNN